MLPSIDNPTTPIEQHLSALYYGPESFRSRIAQPAVLVPLIALAVSALYLFLNARLARTRNLHLSPLEFAAEAVIYLTPGTVLCLLDDLLSPTLFPKPKSERVATHQQKRLVAQRIFYRLASHSFTFTPSASALTSSSSFSSPLASIAQFAESSFTGISSSIQTFDVFTTMGRGRNIFPVRLRNASRVHCYQNSVLQALNTVKALRPFLQETLQDARGDRKMAATTLEVVDVLEKLDGTFAGMGKVYPTPDNLKFMGSNDQEDAQEYFSIILDRLEKEAMAAKHNSRESSPQTSLDMDQKAQEVVSSPRADSIDSGYASGSASAVSHPFKGLYGMRTSCTACGYMDSLRIEPFDFITLHLTPGTSKTSLASELDKNFTMEQVEGVHCNKCTILRWLKQLETKAVSETKKNESLSKLFADKIELAQKAVETETFDDQTIESLGIPRAAKVATTKTKQPSIARPPRHIIFHIGRSEFDQYGRERKIHTPISYPDELDLSPWMLGSAKDSPAFIYGDLNSPEESFATRKLIEKWNMGPQESMVAGSDHESMMRGPRYKLSAVIRHQGQRSQWGHYTCIRREPAIDKKMWWNISDSYAHPAPMGPLYMDDGAYMLFYECVDPMIQHVSAPSLSTSSGDSMTSLKLSPSPAANGSGKRHRVEKRRKRQQKKQQAPERRRSKTFPEVECSTSKNTPTTAVLPPRANTSTATTSLPIPTNKPAVSSTPTTTTAHRAANSPTIASLLTPASSATKRRHTADAKLIREGWKKADMKRRPQKRAKLAHDGLDLQLPRTWRAPMSIPEPGRKRRHSSPI